jgi:alpha-tubulin suppressor-like RCC1 family protein
VLAVAAGVNDSIALQTNGTLIGWGFNQFGALTFPSGLSNVSSIAAGNYHALALKRDGTVIAWGRNIETQTNVPAGLNNVVAIAAGQSHSVALRSDGTVLAWGYNFNGQATVPAGLTNVVAIAAGWFNTLALKSDGTVVAWGYTNTGQASVLAGLTNVAAIAAGEYHSLALLSNGTVVAWGQNLYGQTDVPAGLSNVVAIAAGELYSVAVVDTGSPDITRQPLDQTAFNGTTALFSVTAFGTRPLSYQWQFNGTNLDWATNATLILTNVSTNNAGSYSLILTNGDGVTTSSNAVLTVSDSPPILLSQPADQYIPLSSNTTFAVVTTGSMPMSYQWQFNGTIISGATNPVLSLANVQFTNQGNYSVSVTNNYGGASSTNARLTVVDLAGALDATNLVWTTTGPLPWFAETRFTHDNIAGAQTPLLGFPQQSTLQTTVTGQGTISFWWQWTPLFGFDELSFTVDGGNQVNYFTQGWQQVTLYLLTGSHTLQWTARPLSNPGSIGYLDQVSYTPGATAGLIVMPPADLTVPAGTNITFTVQAGGTPPLSYQWQFNGTNIPGASGQGTFNSVNLIQFGLTNVQAASAGLYSVIVSNSYGMTNASASLTVNPAGPFMLSQPLNQQAVLRGICAFTSNARGSDSLAYQWQFNGNDIPGATNVQLILHSLQTNDIGNYSVVVTNNYGSLTSSNATFTLVPSMLIGWGYNAFGQATVPASISNVTAFAGGNDFTAVINGDRSMVTWGFWGEQHPLTHGSGVVSLSADDTFILALKNDGTILSVPSSGFSALALPPGLSNIISVAAGQGFGVAAKADGTVTAWGSNASGKTNVPVRATNVIAVAAGDDHALALRSDGTVVAWGNNGNGQTNVPPGTSHVTAIAARGVHSMALRDDGTVVAWGPPVYSQTNVPAGLTHVMAIAAGDFANMALKDDGTVLVWADNIFGSTNVPVTITNAVAISSGYGHCLALVNDGSPFITQHPLGQTILSGRSTALRVQAMGTQPMAYQWQLNGTNMDGATNAFLMLANVAVTSAGMYQCVASNVFGAVASLPAPLNVLRTTPQFNSATAGIDGTTGNFGFQLAGLSGHGEVVIYASTNLVDWEAIYTNPPTAGSFQYWDAAATNLPVRFYRAIEQ